MALILPDRYPPPPPERPWVRHWHTIGYLNRPTVDQRIVSDVTPPADNIVGVRDSNTNPLIGRATGFAIQLEDAAIVCVTDFDGFPDDLVLSMDLDSHRRYLPGDDIGVRGTLRGLTVIRRIEWAWQ